MAKKSTLAEKAVQLHYNLQLLETTIGEYNESMKRAQISERNKQMSEKNEMGRNPDDKNKDIQKWSQVSAEASTTAENKLKLLTDAFVNIRDLLTGKP